MTYNHSMEIRSLHMIQLLDDNLDNQMMNWELLAELIVVEVYVYLTHYHPFENAPRD